MRGGRLRILFPSSTTPLCQSNPPTGRKQEAPTQLDYFVAEQLWFLLRGHHR